MARSQNRVVLAACVIARAALDPYGFQALVRELPGSKFIISESSEMEAMNMVGPRLVSYLKGKLAEKDLLLPCTWNPELVVVWADYLLESGGIYPSTDSLIVKATALTCSSRPPSSDCSCAFMHRSDNSLLNQLPSDGVSVTYLTF